MILRPSIASGFSSFRLEARAALKVLPIITFFFEVDGSLLKSYGAWNVKHLNTQGPGFVCLRNYQMRFTMGLCLHLAFTTRITGVRILNLSDT